MINTKSQVKYQLIKKDILYIKNRFRSNGACGDSCRRPGENIFIDANQPDDESSTRYHERVLCMVIKLYDMDTMEYTGSIVGNGNDWEYREVTNEHMISMTKGMPLKAVLSCLTTFNMVYDIIEH